MATTLTLNELLPILPSAAIHILIIDFLRYFAVAAAVYVVVWRLLGGRLAGRRVTDVDPKKGQMAREFRRSLVTVAIFAASGLFIFSLEKLGLTRLYSSIAQHGWPWLGFSLAVLIAAHDTYFYWTHRLLHRPWWFARFHSMHHQSHHPTPWAAYSFHPVEAMIQTVFLITAVLVLPLHGLAIFAFLVWMIVRNVLGHCAHELLPWRALSRGWLRWLTSTSHHHFHHAHNKGNYGLYFTAWDRWMGTEDPNYLSQGDQRWPAERKPV